MTILFESAIRATLIAAIIAVVLIVMRIKTASVRHAVWASVVLLMMLLPAWVAWGPKALLPVLPSERSPSIELLPPPLPAGLADATPRTSPVRQDGGYVLPDAVTVVYFLGFGVLLLRLVIGTIRANRLSSASCIVPVTVGFLHPRIILPESSRDWPQAQLDAVLAHEREHIRRRDPLFQWLALLNRALFWFHPLAWWLERKLSGLAEEACDAAVLARGYDPREYSEYLLYLARSVQSAGTRIEAVGMAMPGIGLKYRIRQMLSGVPVPRISRPRMACTVAVCAAAVVILAAGTLVRAQSGAGSKGHPVFEVASVRPSKPRADDGKTKGGRGGGGLPFRVDHGSFNYTDSLFGFIIRAYHLKGCISEVNCARLSGGPDWLKKDRFDIQAKSPDGAPDYTLEQYFNGEATQLELMLQALLAERFNLQVHREKKELQMYALTVAKKGPKLKKAAEPEMIESPDGRLIQNRSLGFSLGRQRNGETNEHAIVMTVRDRSMQELADSLTIFMDRPVVDRTGLKGTFDITLEYERDPDPVGPGRDVTGPAMFQAFQEQLGLKFVSTKGPVDVLVIDHAEKPSEN